MDISAGGIKALSKIDNVITNRYIYYDFIKNNHDIKKQYKKLYKKFSSVQNGQVAQDGGSATIVLGAIGSIALSSSLAYLLYKWYTRPVCLPSYPLVNKHKVPSISAILTKLLPSAWVKPYKGLQPDLIIKNIIGKINTVLGPLSFLKEDTTVKKIGVQLLKISASVGAAVATVGAGGDIIISLLFTIKNILETILAMVESFLEILNDSEAMRLLFDILNINFMDGPFGVKCWIKYVLHAHGKH